MKQLWWPDTTNGIWGQSVWHIRLLLVKFSSPFSKEQEIETQALIGSDCIGRSNCHTIKTTADIKF
jgi:hypothetical protein